MIVSKLKSLETQGALFDQPLGSHGHVRTVVGDLGEELTAALVGGRRHKTQGNAQYCPDVSVRDWMRIRYYESKVCGLSGQTFVYAGRLRKDMDFVVAGNDLSYVIWHHGAKTLEARTVSELRELVLVKMRSVFVVPFDDIASICADLKEEPLNSKYGRSDNQLYGSGFRISVKFLDPWRWPKLPEGVGPVREKLF